MHRSRRLSISQSRSSYQNGWFKMGNILIHKESESAGVCVGFAKSDFESFLGIFILRMQGSGRKSLRPRLRKRSFSASDGLGKEGFTNAVELRTSSYKTQFQPVLPPAEEKGSLFDASAIVSLRIEATHNGRQHILWFVVPETSQMSISQLENQLRSHLL